MAAAKKTSVRKDPVTRPINAGSPYFELTNQHPERRYVWVFKAAIEHGVDYYEGIGYECVQFQPGGVRGRIGKTLKPGDYIESRGHVLMQVTSERAKEIYEFGEDGGSGQQGADAVERRMFQTKKSLADLARKTEMRSRETGGQYFSFEAESGSVAVIPGDD